MALVLNDRVKETTTTTGTGAIALGGAVSSFETFGAGVGNSNTTYYAIVHQTANEFEVGLGTLDGTSANLTRTTVISSSNSDAAVNFSAGTKDVFCTFPASKAVFKDASDNTNFADNEKIQLGTGSDLQIYHDGSNSFLDNSSGTGEIVLKAGSSRSTLLTNNSSQNIIAAGPTTAYLYNSGSVKLQTTSTGVQTTGTVNVNGAYTLPTTDGSANQVLQTDGSGSVSFATASGVSAGFVIAMSVAL
jgi:hypothetical protein